MKIEAFSEGKNLDAPEANEDLFLALPGKGYAVLDGATDISGQAYEGRHGGWLASRIVAQATAEFLLNPAERELQADRLIEYLSAAIRASYAKHGILDIVHTDRARRFGATLTLAADLGETIRFVLIGDSGLRIDGTEIVVNDTGLDLVTASLRVEAYRIVQVAGGGADDRSRVGRACAFYGVAKLHPDMRPWLDDSTRAEVCERSLAWCRARFPAVPEADIRRLLDTGISGQARFANNTASPLSYAVLDGFEIPLPLVTVLDRPRATIRSIELFTDGYFKPGATAALSDWEAAFAEVESVDPEKIGRYPSVKGSSTRIRTDDRTVLIVHL
jgi:protein phosphatase 2C-like protein